MKITQEISNKLANMSFFCTVLIVLGHTERATHGCVGLWINKWILTGLASIAVPIFFMISGFLLAKNIDREDWWRTAIKKRIRSLLVPYIILGILWFIIKYSVHWIGVTYFGADSSFEIMRLTWRNFLVASGIVPWDGLALGVLWYVRTLFALVVISPFFVFIMRKGRMASLALLALLLIGWALQTSYIDKGTAVGHLMTFDWCMRCPLFFCLGIGLNLYWADQAHSWEIPVCFLISILCLYLWIGLGVSNIIIRFVLTLSAACLFWRLMPKKRWPNILTGNSFSIYILHWMLFWLIPIPFKAFGLYGVFKSHMISLLYAATVITLAIAIASLLKRRIPRAAGVVFGGR